MHLHRSPKVYFLDLRTRLVDKYDQEERAQTMSHEEDSFDRLYSCLEKIMILSTMFDTREIRQGHQYGPYNLYGFEMRVKIRMGQNEIMG